MSRLQEGIEDLELKPLYVPSTPKGADSKAKDQNGNRRSPARGGTPKKQQQQGSSPKRGSLKEKLRDKVVRPAEKQLDALIAKGQSALENVEEVLTVLYRYACGDANATVQDRMKYSQNTANACVFIKSISHGVRIPEPDLYWLLTSPSVIAEHVRTVRDPTNKKAFVLAGTVAIDSVSGLISRDILAFHENDRWNAASYLFLMQNEQDPDVYVEHASRFLCNFIRFTANLPDTTIDEFGNEASTKYKNPLHAYAWILARVFGLCGTVEAQLDNDAPFLKQQWKSCANVAVGKACSASGLLTAPASACAAPASISSATPCPAPAMSPTSSHDGAVMPANTQQKRKRTDDENVDVDMDVVQNDAEQPNAKSPSRGTRIKRHLASLVTSSPAGKRDGGRKKPGTK